MVIVTVRKFNNGDFFVNEVVNYGQGPKTTAMIDKWLATPPPLVDPSLPESPENPRLPPNEVEEYSPSYGYTIQLAKDAKQAETDKYEQSLTDEANKNPYVGKHTTARKNRQYVAMCSKRTTNNGNGNGASSNNSGNTPPSQEENARNTVLADYEGSVYSASDLVYGILEDLTDIDAILSLDVSTAVNWPEWTPPG